MAAATDIEQTSEPRLPDTAPGHLIGEWLKLCGGVDAAQMEAWFASNLSEKAAKRLSAKGRAGLVSALCSTGGFRVGEIKSSSAGEISVVAAGNQSDIWLDMTFLANDAGQLDGTGIGPTSPPESSLPSKLDDATVVLKIREIVGHLASAGLFSGIVTVARGTRVIASVDAGFANRAKQTAISRSTRFSLGSLGKMFTGVAVGQLVDEHKLTFEDRVGAFFPDYPNKTVRENVTVGMLLSHTSGMGDFLDARTPEMLKNGVSRAADFMPLYDQAEPTFAPGTDWSYSNAGLALAGAIVEKVSGEDYPHYLERHVFAVAGMSNSSANNRPQPDSSLVTPYTHQTEQGMNESWHEAEADIGSPAGGAISTTEDLLRFADALRSGRLIRPAVFKSMSTPHSPQNAPEMYGYAMEIEARSGRRVVGHGGGFPGVSTHLYMVTDSPYTIVVLENQDPPAEAYIGETIAALMAKKAELEQKDRP